uniref:Cytohesin Ubiquitin Protein Inducing domain-containing protein n=1 Tax=Pavo cristatus TaxID=9049 RepID=A0A8C9F7K6_PAVCR
MCWGNRKRRRRKWKRQRRKPGPGGGEGGVGARPPPCAPPRRRSRFSPAHGCGLRGRMELRGHILPPGTHSPAGPPPGRLQELRERQRGLRQALGLRLRELRRLCLQEAELTGKLPPEYPLEPGERPQPPPRRRSAAPPRGPLTEAARAARREVAVQLQVVEAARRLASAPGLPPEQRRRRQRLQAEAAQRLRQLRAQLDENGSLCELPGLENGECLCAMQGAARRGGQPHFHALCSLPHRLPPPETPPEWGWTPLAPQGPIRQPRSQTPLGLRPLPGGAQPPQLACQPCQPCPHSAPQRLQFRGPQRPGHPCPGTEPPWAPPVPRLNREGIIFQIWSWSRPPRGHAPDLTSRPASWPHIASAAASTNQRAALAGGARGHWLEQVENAL